MNDDYCIEYHRAYGEDMTESELYQRHLKPLLKRKGLFYQRFESPKIPDLYISNKGRVLWAELKCINKSQKIIKPAWRPGQLSWIKEHEKYNPTSTCLILYYCEDIFWLRPKKFYTKEEIICQRDRLLDYLIQ